MLATPAKVYHQNSAALEEAISPKLTHSSRWPGQGRHPLVLLQQAAVNLAFRETESGGLIGINGPPGTGKTTLLRGIVAGIVTERAEAMAKFDDPEEAFEHSGQKIRAGTAWIHLYRLNRSLRGFEMIIASSNNKAVENVSAELPDISAIANDARALRYFKTLSDAIYQSETWGIIAAVLGNAQNRGRFKQTFWWDDDNGLNSYLSAAVGTVRQITETDTATGAVIHRLPKIVAKASLELQKAEAARRAACAQHQQAKQRILEARQNHGVIFADSEFFALEHSKRHQMTPWFTSQAQRLRDEVFIRAMALQRAFIDAAAKPLRHNLGALMNVFTTQTLPDSEKQALLPDLWASLFLVTPLISTTFASVNRMLGKLPLESLGWLLIDEAGQAVPQAAVGAILRTRRAVIVGDPAQIEPVVVLPETLTHAICRHFGVDPDHFAAPSASVQTLADAASSYSSEFQTIIGSRNVGIPLLVHRRCSEPMFGIANAIAYSGLMVSAKPVESSAIRGVLGPSGWFHVEGTSVDKWCPEEGVEVLRLLRQLAQAAATPDLYIITPFVIVAEHLRQIVRESGVLNGWVSEDDWRWTYDRIGTVHTAQGREAEAVILVLGAPNPAQTGARGWAGGRPNLLNVAVTRAEEVIYVIGNRRLWREAGLFRELDKRLPQMISGA